MAAESRGAGHTVCDFGGVEEREVEGDEAVFAAARLHAGDDCLVVFGEVGGRVVGVGETHGGNGFGRWMGVLERDQECSGWDGAARRVWLRWVCCCCERVNCPGVQ